MDITADDCYLENIVFVGTTSGATALVDNAADETTFYKVEFVAAATPTNMVTIASGEQVKFHYCRWNGAASTCAADYGVLFESATENESKHFEFIGCIFNFGLYDLDVAAISNASNGTVEGGIIKDCVFSGMLLTAVDFNSSSSAAVRGIICDNRATAYAGITVQSIFDFSSYGGTDNLATDAPAAASPQAFPAATAT